MNVRDSSFKTKIIIFLFKIAYNVVYNIYTISKYFWQHFTVRHWIEYK